MAPMLRRVWALSGPVDEGGARGHGVGGRDGPPLTEHRPLSCGLRRRSRRRPQPHRVRPRAGRGAQAAPSRRETLAGD
jgi:hypothetical protein